MDGQTDRQTDGHAAIANTALAQQHGKLTCQMGPHSDTCHPTGMRIQPLPPAEASTRFSDPGGMQGWVDLCYVRADRPGIEPATCKSQVQHPTGPVYEGGHNRLSHWADAVFSDKHLWISRHANNLTIFLTPDFDTSYQSVPLHSGLLVPAGPTINNSIISFRGDRTAANRLNANSSKWTAGVSMTYHFRLEYVKNWGAPALGPDLQNILRQTRKT